MPMECSSKYLCMNDLFNQFKTMCKCIRMSIIKVDILFVLSNNNQSCSPLGLCGALWGPDDRGWCGGGCYCWNLRGQNQAI